MSHTQIFAFKKDGSILRLPDVKNSFRGAYAVWHILEEKYLPKLQFSRHILAIGSSREADPMQEVWDLYKRDDVNTTDKIVLISTFDGAICLREDLPRLIAAFRAFQGDTNLPQQAESIATIQDDPEVWAVGWNQTSVTEPMWRSYDEEADEMINYDFTTNTNHFSIFAKEPLANRDQDTFTKDELRDLMTMGEYYMSATGSDLPDSQAMILYKKVRKMYHDKANEGR